MRLTAAAARAVAADPAVASVLPDVAIPAPPAPPSSESQPAGPTVSGRAVHASCGTAAHPELDPEAITTIDAPGAWRAGATGRGVTVAYLADGIDPGNADLRRNRTYASPASPAGSRVITSYRDFSGDGTAAPTGGAEAFGDAASIAAQGNVTYDLSRFVSRAHPLPRGCDIRIVGAAPGATLLALKVYSQNGVTTGSGFVQAINYAVASGAKVINESFGSNGFPDTATDIYPRGRRRGRGGGRDGRRQHRRRGGSLSTIGVAGDGPARDRGWGATTTFRAYQQDTYGGINAPVARLGWGDLIRQQHLVESARAGIAQDGKTVNLVAPGTSCGSLCSANVTQVSPSCKAARHVQDFGGTSQASPLTAGAAADVIPGLSRRRTSGASARHPRLVERILIESARDIAAPADQQGAGLLDIGAAVRLARSIAGSVARPTGGVLASTSQVDLAGAPRSATSATVTLTNTSSTPEHLALATRALAPSGAVAGSITLIPAVHTSQPRFSIWSGAAEVYQRRGSRCPRSRPA